MNCKHGNKPPCCLCDEIEAAVDVAYKRGQQDALAALRQQAGQAEPVAWTWPIGKRGKDEPRHNWAISHRRPPNGFGGENAEPLYTAPPRARVTREGLRHAARIAIMGDASTEDTDMLAALHSLGLDVEVEP